MNTILHGETPTEIHYYFKSIYRNILFFYIYRTFTKAQMQSKLLLADFLQTTVLAAICVCCTVLYVETTLLQ